MRACELDCVYAREKREERMKDRQSERKIVCVRACVWERESKRVCACGQIIRLNALQEQLNDFRA